ncbi:MAG: alpha/beta hydrolase [Promethearchaeota archaeon]
MAYEEISKVHKVLGKLIEERFEVRGKITREFAAQNGIQLRDIASGNLDPKTMLELNRYTSNIMGEERIKKIPSDIKIDQFNIGNIAAEWISAPGVNEDKVFLNLFGGGYIMSTFKGSRLILYQISRATHLRCLSIKYRLAPENPFPAALNDSIEAYKWLLSNGFDPKKIFIGGQSAGGGLAVATMLKLRELNLPLPAGAVLMSAWADLTGSGKSIIENQKFEPLIKEGLVNMARLYAQEEPLSNPLISPVFADLKGLPPLLIQAGSIEALVDDSNFLADGAKKAGVEVELEIYENMTHVFQSFGEDLPESMKAFERIGQFIQKII